MNQKHYIHNPFSKVTMATSVNDIITVNVMNGPTEMDNDGTGHGYNCQRYNKHIVGKKTQYTERHT